MNVWKTLEESMNMNGMNDMRPRCIIPESFENAYSYFEDLALLYDKVNNITVDSNKIWKPTVSQSGVISWNRSEDETEPSPVNIKGPQGIQGNEGPQGPRGNDGARGPAGPSGENGVDGFSPVVEVFPIQGGHQVNITDATHSESFNVMDGTPGADNTNVWRPTVADNGEISWEKSNVATAPAPMNIMGPQGPAGNDGLPGVNGESGFSPYVNVTPITNGYEVNITDANGTQTFNLYNGARGEQGPAGNDGLPGVNGESGFSPYVNVAPITNGYEVNITDANGTQTFNLYNGAPGQSGEPGPRGNDGESGFSPYVNVTPITNGYEVNITDANGTQTFNLYNGATGEQGPRGNDGESGFSPYVNVTAITNGHEVNITDVNGVHSFNVYDGQLGEQGPRGNDGSPGLNGADGFSPVITVTALNDGTRNYNQVNITSAQGTNSFNVYDGTNGSGGGGNVLNLHLATNEMALLYANGAVYSGNIFGAPRTIWVSRAKEQGFSRLDYLVGWHSEQSEPMTGEPPVLAGSIDLDMLSTMMGSTLPMNNVCLGTITLQNNAGASHTGNHYSTIAGIWLNGSVPGGYMTLNMSYLVYFRDQYWMNGVYSYPFFMAAKLS